MAVSDKCVKLSLRGTGHAGLRDSEAWVNRAATCLMEVWGERLVPHVGSTPRLAAEGRRATGGLPPPGLEPGSLG